MDKLPPVEQEKALKESFRAALQGSDSDDDEEGGGLLKAKQRTNEEKQQEDNEYRQWLTGHTADITQHDQQQLKGKHE